MTQTRALDENPLLIHLPALVRINFQQLYLEIAASSILQDPPLLVLTGSLSLPLEEDSEP